MNYQKPLTPMSEKQSTIVSKCVSWFPLLTGVVFLSGYVLLFANLPTRVQALEAADREIMQRVLQEGAKAQETRERMIRMESKMDAMLDIMKQETKGNK